MPRVRIAEAEAQELEEAAAWYEEEAPGTGERLVNRRAPRVDAFENALTLLRDEPIPLASTTEQAGSLGAKRLLLYRFPFDVVVIEENGELVVVALAHQFRRPGYWIDRLRK